MKRKTILIIGAGREQVPAFELSKKMGLEIISTDIDENAPGFRLSDHKLLVSTRDAEKTFETVKNFCKSHKIDGVLTVANDVPLTVSKIANYYSLPGLAIKSSKLLSDKISMKEKFVSANVKTPPFMRVKELEDIKKFSKLHDFPFVLKPVDGRGSKGVVILKSFSDVKKFFHIPKSITKKNYLIIEKYLEGPQLSVESVFLDKKYFPVAFADRNYDLRDLSHPFSFEDGGDIPSNTSDLLNKKISNLVECASKSLGINWGTVKADIVLSDGEPQIIELAGRLSGGDFSTFSIPEVYGVDLVSIAIRLALGMKVTADELEKSPIKAYANRYIYSLTDGVIHKFAFPNGLSKNIHVSKFLDEGDKVTAINSGVLNTRAGVVKVVAADIIEARKIVTEVVKKTKFSVA